jgi:hypothetical protein
MVQLNPDQIESALGLLGERLTLAKVGPYRLVVCGGAALIACSLISRETTKDIDVVALIDGEGHVVSPDPLPSDLLRDVAQVGRDLDLPPDWLNNGPSRNPGGLFQVGLPAGFKDRLTRQNFGSALAVYFVGRLDQIHFKVYAAVDQGTGRHVDDLRDLRPTADEIEKAARWAMTHDPSEGFRTVLTSMLRQLGYEETASRL